MQGNDSYGKAALMLANAVRDGSCRSVLFVSSSSGEGTSTAVLHVADLLSEAYGLRPLVVELGSRPSAYVEHFYLDPKRNIQHASDAVKIGECLQRSGELAFLPAAAKNGFSTATDVVSLVKKILQETGDDYDIVLFDSPPILSHPETLAAAGVVRKAVVVVEAGQTNTEQLQRVKQELDLAEVTILGAVLNKHKRFIPGWLYRRM